MAGKSFVFRFADVVVREREFSLTKGGEVLSVEPKAFRVLLILLRNPQKLLTKDELLTAVWGDTAVSENSLARSIALLRRLLGDEARDPRFIETVATVGYRWVCKVEVSEDASGSPEGQADPRPPDAEREVVQRRKRLPVWLLAAVCVLVVCLAGAAGYLHRPLPPPRITAYTQLTQDGYDKSPAGTDGSRLYFTQSVGAPIAQIAVAGGQIQSVPVSIPNIAFLEDVSPDGNSLIVATSEKGFVIDRPQWIVRVSGGTVRRLPNGEQAAFSPDGNHVAFHTGDGGIWLVQVDGSGTHKLASVGPIPFSLGWAPDGRVLRFPRNDGRLWEISADGSNLHEVIPNWQGSLVQSGGRWTSDGRFFLFVASNRDREDAQVWVLDERRRLPWQPAPQPIQLTSGPVTWSSLVPGKDGKTLFAEGRKPRGELSRFDAKTHRFLPFLGGISAGCVSFSRDGKFVAYVSYPEGILWKADSDGSNRVQLTDRPLQVFAPRWSPDGSQIVFTGLALNPDEPFRIDAHRADHIYLVPVQGGAPTRLLPDDVESEVDPNWSPDGRRVVFASALKELHIFDMDTRQTTTVPGSDGTFSPRWSPNGHFIAALGVGAKTLKLFDTQTQQWSVLAEKEFLGYPAWSNDSRSVYVVNLDRVGIFRVPVNGGNAQLVADLKDWPTTWWGWMGLDPDDAPMMIHDISSNDIYALTLEEK